MLTLYETDSIYSSIIMDNYMPTPLPQISLTPSKQKTPLRTDQNFGLVEGMAFATIGHN
jgi:hypothetical protein